MYLPLHYIVTDATGASLVIEFVDGKMHLHDSHDGVLTNAPTYHWQRENLALYQHLSLVGPSTSVSSSGGPPVGGGLVGMPGDPMSSSRFVRAATLVKGFKQLPADGTGWLPAPGGTAAGVDPVQTPHRSSRRRRPAQLGSRARGDVRRGRLARGSSRSLRA